MNKNKIEMTAKSIWDEHKNSNDYKATLGEKGLFEQTERNERFYVGDQWLKNSTKSNLPLIVINFIKRIGEYKLSQLLSNPLTACFSAEGIPSYNTDKQQENADNMKDDVQCFVHNIVEKYNSIGSHEHKSRIHTFFSVNKDYISFKIGEAAKAGAFNWEHEKLNGLKELLSTGF